jgi:hypothetical protein
MENSGTILNDVAVAVAAPLFPQQSQSSAEVSGEIGET